jgi:uncharacterized protein
MAMPTEKRDLSQLSARQYAIYESFEELADEFGPFDQSSGPDGAHYMPAASNPFTAEGLQCSNCAFYEGPQACEIVGGTIEPGALCKLWVIPLNLLSAEVPAMGERDGTPGVERRYVEATLRIEVEAEERAEGDQAAPKIVGHASVFDEWTTLYEGRYWVWREIVRPGAFTRAIKKKQDVRALFNHDSNFVLGRTKSGTLSLEEDAKGLLSRITPPDTQAARDLLTSIKRGDVTGMSFAFTPTRAKKVKQTEQNGVITIENGGERITQRYEGDTLIEERELLDLDLYDVSPVTYPAYAGTDVDMRSRPDVRALIAERDRPHRRSDPWLDGIKAWLGSSATAGGARS